MRNIILILLLFQIQNHCFSQILSQNGQGENVFSAFLNRDVSSTLININTGTQSAGVDYYFTTKANNPSDYKIFRAGLSAKATDGIGAVIANGQFSPGAKLSASLTKVRVFAPQLIGKFDDWLSINVSGTADKYKLYRKDTTFKKQLTDTVFRGFNLGLDYTMAFGNDPQNFANIKAGYERRNSFSDLTAVDVDDNRTTFDSSSATNRIARKTVTAREGNYNVFDAFAWGITYTHLPKSQKKNAVDPAGNEITEDKTEKTTERITYPDSSVELIVRETIKKTPVANPYYKSLKFGYSLYFNSLATNIDKPVSNIGFILFLLGPNKDDILVSKMGLDFRFKDILDSKKTNSGLLKRFYVALTTVITL